MRSHTTGAVRLMPPCHVTRTAAKLPGGGSGGVGAAVVLVIILRSADCISFFELVSALLSARLVKC